MNGLSAWSAKFMSANTAKYRGLAPIYHSLGITDYYLRAADRADRPCGHNALQAHV